MIRAGGSTGSDAGEAPVITISAAEIAEMRERAPARADIEAAIDEEVLYREALRRGLDAGDAVVERRLVQNMRFVTEDDSRDAAQVLRRARAAGLFADDAVIRRRLVQKMRFLLEQDGESGPPSEAEQRSYFAAHADQFSLPPRVRLTQIFFGGANATEKANTTLADLRHREVLPGDAVGRGDAFVTGAVLPMSTEASLAKLFGSDFATRAMSMPAGEWSGPVASLHGAHLVWVHEKTARSRADFGDVRGTVRERLFAERAERARREGLRRLRERYVVKVDQIG